MDGIPVNHEVLVWARESIAQTKSAVVEKSGISLRRLNQIESGAKHPDLDELKALAKIYERTVAILLLSKPPKEKPLPEDRRTTDSKALGVFDPKTISAIRKSRTLAQSLIELKKTLGIEITPFRYTAKIHTDVEKKAAQIRADLKLDEVRSFKKNDDALNAYIEKVEHLSVAVFQMSLTKDNLRGFSIVDEEIPIIGIKRGEKPTSKIFTLFHELGHMLLNTGGLCDISLSIREHTSQIERWCNALAAEILIPKEDLLAQPLVQKYRQEKNKIWAKKDLIEVSNFFHVGPLALLRSLLTQGLTTSTYYNEKHQAWNKPSWGRSKGRNIPKETIREKGRNYIHLAFSAYDKNRIDIRKLSDFLGVNFHQIPKTRECLNAR